MINKLMHIVLLGTSLLLNQCSTPIEPIEKHLQKLWDVPLNELSNSGIAVSESFLIFKTQVNIAGQLYKLSKDGKNVQKISIGGCAYGIPIVQNNVIYNNTCVYSLYALNENDLSVIWSKTGFKWIPIPAVDENYF